MSVEMQTGIDVAGETLPARSDLMGAIEEGWTRLARTGSWWTGAERIAIAAETRNAARCELCAARKLSISPAAVAGTHGHLGMLSSEAVEAIHKLATDASRITERWVRSLADGPLGEEPYVELIGIVATITALDTFDTALGRPLRPLPTLFDQGQPPRRRPAGAAQDLAWVSTVAPEAMEACGPNPYPLHGDKNIHRALSLVPQAVVDFFDLDVELYLKDHEIRDFSREPRAITHRQIELVAGRVSALNRCYY